MKNDNKKPNILIISSYCFENCTANGICGRNLYDAYVEMGYNVHIVGLGEDVVRPYGQHSFTYEGNPTQKKRRLDSIRSLFSVRYDDQKIKKYYEISEKVILENAIDLVIAMYFPGEAIEAAKKLKQKYPDLCCVMYELDSATDNSEDTRFVSKLRLASYARWMRDSYRILDRSIVMRCHEKHVEKLYGNISCKKVSFSDLPVLIKKETSIVDDDICMAIYAGLLNKTYRSPEYLLRIFKKMNRPNTQLHFFSSGNCEQIIENSIDQGMVFKHGRVSPDELLEWENKADIMVNIGNKDRHSLPSKLIYYFSVGKPIIHISNSTCDACVDYLKKYPLALILYEEDDIDRNIAKLKAFMDECVNEKVDYEVIEKLYPENTPFYNANLILGILRKGE